MCLPTRLLLLIGQVLVGEGSDQRIPKGDIDFATAFPVLVERLNTQLCAKAPPPWCATALPLKR